MALNVFKPKERDNNGQYFLNLIVPHCDNEYTVLFALGGVRLSISQYGRVWEETGKNNSIIRVYFRLFALSEPKNKTELIISSAGQRISFPLVHN